MVNTCLRCPLSIPTVLRHFPQTHPPSVREIPKEPLQGRGGQMQFHVMRETRCHRHGPPPPSTQANPVGPSPSHPRAAGFQAFSSCSGSRQLDTVFRPLSQHPGAWCPLSGQCAGEQGRTGLALTMSPQAIAPCHRHHHIKDEHDPPPQPRYFLFEGQLLNTHLRLNSRAEIPPPSCHLPQRPWCTLGACVCQGLLREQAPWCLPLCTFRPSVQGAPENRWDAKAETGVIYTS